MFWEDEAKCLFFIERRNKMKRKTQEQNRVYELLKKSIRFLNEDAMVPGRIIYQNLDLTEKECEEFGIDRYEIFVENY